VGRSRSHCPFGAEEEISPRDCGAKYVLEKAMKSVHQCPVCHGTGKFTGPINFGTTSDPLEKTCHGCGGKGWVVIGKNDPPETPYPCMRSHVYPT